MYFYWNQSVPAQNKVNYDLTLNIYICDFQFCKQDSFKYASNTVTIKMKIGQTQSSGDQGV